MRIVTATSKNDYLKAKAIIDEYTQALGVDLYFQNYSDEINRLSEYYGPPRGCLLIAMNHNTAVGCIALRSLGPDICEMKRLYVRPEWRGRGLGLKLSRGIIRCARNLGYHKMVLDTLAGMVSARKLYQFLGFRETDSYYHNPLPDVKYLALDLTVNQNRKSS